MQRAGNDIVLADEVGVMIEGELTLICVEVKKGIFRVPILFEQTWMDAVAHARKTASSRAVTSFERLHLVPPSIF